MRVMLLVFVSAFFWMRKLVRKTMVKYQIKRTNRRAAHILENLCAHQRQNCYWGWMMAAAGMIYLSAWLWLWLVDHLYEWWLRSRWLSHRLSHRWNCDLHFLNDSVALPCILNALHRPTVQCLLLRLFLRNMKKHYDKHTQNTKHRIGLENSSQ